jgi:hypothetical protein
LTRAPRAEAIAEAMQPGPRPLQTRAVANAAHRLARARLAALQIIVDTFEDVKVTATDSIEELLVQFSENIEFAMRTGHSSDHVHRTVWSFRELQRCLNSQGFLAPMAAEALDLIWNEPCVDGCTGQAEYFKDCGLEASFTDCMHAAQDAIAMSMIRDGTLQHVMDMQSITLEVKSKLRHSYFIMKRYLRDVSQHLSEFAAELPSDHAEELRELNIYTTTKNGTRKEGLQATARVLRSHMPILVAVYIFAVPMGTARIYTTTKIGMCDPGTLAAAWTPSLGVPFLVVVYIFSSRRNGLNGDGSKDVEGRWCCWIGHEGHEVRCLQAFTALPYSGF